MPEWEGKSAVATKSIIQMRRLPPKCKCGKVEVAHVTKTGKKKVKFERGTTNRGKKNVKYRKPQKKRKLAAGLRALGLKVK